MKKLWKIGCSILGLITVATVATFSTVSCGQSTPKLLNQEVANIVVQNFPAINVTVNVPNNTVVISNLTTNIANFLTVNNNNQVQETTSQQLENQKELNTYVSNYIKEFHNIELNNQEWVSKIFNPNNNEKIQIIFNTATYLPANGAISAYIGYGNDNNYQISKEPIYLFGFTKTSGKNVTVGQKSAKIIQPPQTTAILEQVLNELVSWLNTANLSVSQDKLLANLAPTTKTLQENLKPLNHLLQKTVSNWLNGRNLKHNLSQQTILFLQSVFQTISGQKSLQLSNLVISVNNAKFNSEYGTINVFIQIGNVASSSTLKIIGFAENPQGN